jgi:2'-5' RNA ligase
MPRLFTGIEVPPEVSRSLALLRGGLPGARWVEPEDYHITLRFIGDIDERTANDIAEALDGVARRGFELSLDNLDAFGGNKPRSVFAGVRPAPGLSELQADHEKLMRRYGLEPETRRFTPHVTLARFNGDTSSRQVADYLALRGGYRSPSFRVSRFVLYSSRDSVGGGPYVVEASYPLR